MQALRKCLPLLVVPGTDSIRFDPETKCSALSQIKQVQGGPG